ncbi:MAG: dipeptide ABC transporter ATP-binding protein [Saprospiraceae bacterium]
MPDDDIRRLRGAEIAMIFQEPMSSLNPVFRCGDQITEAIQLHRKVPRAEAKDLTISLFERVRLPDPARIFRAFPHEISGGQKQRVMIAMAISCQPALLIADEPTTALDVTVQKSILELLAEIRAETGMSMLFISHDLGVVSEVADRVAVMFRGKIVETGRVADVFQNPQHPYTRGLVACRPSLSRRLHRLPTVADFLENRNFEARVVSEQETENRKSLIYGRWTLDGGRNDREAATPTQPILKVKNLAVRFPAKKNWLGQPTEWLRAVDEVSFEVFPGETFGIVGESGSGKTTLGRAIARLTDAHAGEIWYTPHPSPLIPHPSKTDLLGLREAEMRPFRRDIQIIFQDPFSSLNPRMTVGEAIMEPMQVHGLHGTDAARREKTVELLETVQLSPAHFDRLPHALSGGQRQRACIARALAVEPRLLICDEIVSALDVSVQATVLNLLMDLREKLGLTYLFISHDLSVVKQICDRVMVMHRGKIEEMGFPDALFSSPRTEYVRRLLAAVPGQASTQNLRR